VLHPNNVEVVGVVVLARSVTSEVRAFTTVAKKAINVLVNAVALGRLRDEQPLLEEACIDLV